MSGVGLVYLSEETALVHVLSRRGQGHVHGAGGGRRAWAAEVGTKK